MKECNLELGQVLFTPNKIQSYSCEDWVVALLRDIDRKLETMMWNIHQEEYDSPFANTGAQFIGNNFEVHAYNWDEDVEQPFNFKCGDTEISWYKYLGRGTTINGIYTKEQIINMYNTCMDELGGNDEKS